MSWAWRRIGSGRPTTDEHHERLIADDDGPTASDRSVGLVLAAGSAVIGVIPLLRGHPVRLWAILLAGVLMLASLVRPRVLQLLNRAWFLFGALASTVVTWVLMLVLFYGVVTPIGLLLRAFGRDLLRLRFEPDARTYWLERRPPGPSPETMKNQF